MARILNAMLTLLQHGQALPQATTESAKEARKAFFCTPPGLSLKSNANIHQGELCNKGYARQNEFDAHEGSYDHQHRKVPRPLLPFPPLHTPPHTIPLQSTNTHPSASKTSAL